MVDGVRSRCGSGTRLRRETRRRPPHTCQGRGRTRRTTSTVPRASSSRTTTRCVPTRSKARRSRGRAHRSSCCCPASALRSPSTPHSLRIWRATATPSWGPMQDFAVNGAEHLNFTDNSVLYMPVLHPVGQLGSIDGARGIVITRDMVRAFLDQGIRGTPASIFEATVGRYGELHAP